MNCWPGLRTCCRRFVSGHQNGHWQCVCSTCVPFKACWASI